jgi:hypothetical protein
LKRPRPDTRLSWRDPQMPVIRDYRFRDGRVMTNVDPEYERRYREMLVSASNNPKWDKDPTYNMRKRNV